jgi:hypothetical protein
LDKTTLSRLVDLFGTATMNTNETKSKDLWESILNIFLVNLPLPKERKGTVLHANLRSKNAC